MDPLRLSLGSGQRSFTFSASARAVTWGHQALMLVFPSGDDLIVTPTPGPRYRGRPVLSLVVQLLTRTIHSSVTWFRETPNSSQSLSASEKRPPTVAARYRDGSTRPREGASALSPREVYTLEATPPPGYASICATPFSAHLPLKIPPPWTSNAWLLPLVHENIPLMRSKRCSKQAPLIHKVDAMEFGRW